MDAERLGNWRHDGSGFQLGLTNLRDLSSVDPADSAAWRPVVRAAVAAARPAAAAEVQLRAAAVEVQLRAAAVEERGAPPEAAHAPRLEAAVEARGAPQDAEAEPRGAPPLEAADAPRLQAAVEARGAPRAAEAEALGARPEAVEVKAPDALPWPGVEVRGARPMAALVVGPAAVSVAQSPARRLAEAVARAVPAAVALVVLTTVPAASQRLQHLAPVVRMALSSWVVCPGRGGWPGCCEPGAVGDRF